MSDIADRSAVAVAPLRTWLVARAVLLEGIRRREFYVLVLFMGLFLMGAIVVRIVKIENPATATFLLNLGLTLAFTFAKIITVLTAARQFPDEVEKHTLYPLLAKPLGRGEYLLGKWAASVITGLVTLIVLFLMAWLPVPRMEEYSDGTWAQMLLFEVLSLGMLGALAILFSLLMPKALNIVVLAILVLAGGRMIALLRSHFLGSAMHEMVQWITGYIPDFTRLDLLTRYTDGLPPLGPTDMMLRVVYAIAFTAFPLTLAVWLIQRRPL
jgi:ABC-type transport system involved in multi-copper enzyme maturation permease subunit